MHSLRIKIFKEIHFRRCPYLFQISFLLHNRDKGDIFGFHLFSRFSLLSVACSNMGYYIWGFCCKKSGYFTKPVKNITNRIFICHKQVNNDTKSNSYSLKRQQNYFCNRTFSFKYLYSQRSIVLYIYVPRYIII